MSFWDRRGKGRDWLQQKKWEMNAFKILYVLMESFPIPCKTSDLERLTGLDRKTITTHLKELTRPLTELYKSLVEKCSRGSWRAREV